MVLARPPTQNCPVSGRRIRAFALAPRVLVALACSQLMLPPAELDEILTLQLAVAWAGEGADQDERRLGWWKTDLVSKYGGLALFERLAPRTAVWAAYETAREAARRTDADRRSADASPDQLLSLFHLGFEIDEQLEDRLLDLKHAGAPPHEALPRLAALSDAGGEWQRDAFAKWLAPGPAPKTVQEPSGLRLVGELPATAVARARALTAALASMPERYPCPHYRDV